MSNMNSLITKLQMALKQKGKVYCINKSQFYSKKHDCMCNSYTVWTTYIDENGDKQKDNTYFKKKIDIVLFLVGKLRECDST